jgi:hypothetical protein
MDDCLNIKLHWLFRRRWGLTQALPAADGCIKTSGVERQTVIARVEQATGQVSRGAPPAQAVFTVAKIIGGG